MDVGPSSSLGRAPLAGCALFSLAGSAPNLGFQVRGQFWRDPWSVPAEPVTMDFGFVSEPGRRRMGIFRGISGRIFQPFSIGTSKINNF